MVIRKALYAYNGVTMSFKIFTYIFRCPNFDTAIAFSGDTAASDSKKDQSAETESKIEPSINVCVYKELSTFNSKASAQTRYSSEFQEDDRIGFLVKVSGDLDSSKSDFTETWMQGTKLVHKAKTSLSSDQIYKSSKKLKPWRGGDWTYGLTNKDGTLHFKAAFRVQRLSKSYVISFKDLPKDCANVAFEPNQKRKHYKR